MSRKPDPRTNSNAWRQVRTFESECHAFERIGVSRTPRVHECELMRRFENTCVPEGIGHAMSVEVKRIVDNRVSVSRQLLDMRIHIDRHSISVDRRRAVGSTVPRS